jgi:hypothetical protein
MRKHKYLIIIAEGHYSSGYRVRTLNAAPVGSNPPYLYEYLNQMGEGGWRVVGTASLLNTVVMVTLECEID